jgi:hypothetical protein
MRDAHLALLAHVPEDFRPAALETLLKWNPAYFVEPIDEATAADLLSRTQAALAQLRTRRVGPIYRRVEGRILYTRGDVLTWFQSYEAKNVGAPIPRRGRPPVKGGASC